MVSAIIISARSGLGVTTAIGFQVRVCCTQCRGVRGPDMLIGIMARLQDDVALTGVSLYRTDVADVAVPVTLVVPTDERARPLGSPLKAREARC